jgi:hypothetical protein
MGGWRIGCLLDVEKDDGKSLSASFTSFMLFAHWKYLMSFSGTWAHWFYLMGM